MSELPQLQMSEICKKIEKFPMPLVNTFVQISSKRRLSAESTKVYLLLRKFSQYSCTLQVLDPAGHRFRMTAIVEKLKDKTFSFYPPFGLK